MISNSTEIYRKLSSQIQQQFPEFIQTEGPKFVAFLKAYFEYLEQSGNLLDAQRGLFDTLDIDRTSDEFVEYFHREFMDLIPRNILADKRLLTKYIREFYTSRGSQESYRFLFRAMFNEEIDFYYPGDDILRASDGRWVQETVIRGRTNSGNPFELDGKEITGQTSGAKARVQEILQITASGITLFQLRIENVIGAFQENEIVSDSNGNSIKIYNAVGSIENIIIVDGGAFHQTGDSVLLSGDNGGTATGTITSTTDQSGITFRIVNGGSGYRIANSVISINGGDPDIPAQFRIVNLSNTQNITICTTIINDIKNIVLSNVPFGSGPVPWPTSNVNSTLNSLLTFANTVVGSINTIALVTPGSGYTGSLPVVTVLDSEVRSQLLTDPERGNYKGDNAVIIASRAFGAITGVSIDSSDINFLKNDTISITNSSRSSANTTDLSTDTYGGITRGLIRKGLFPASVTAEIKGTFNIPGRYIDTKGFLSWNNMLQDNDYYQEYSYVILASKTLDMYKNVLKALVHPSGTKMFGTLQHNVGLNLGTYNNTNSAAVIWTRLHTNNVIQILKATPKSVRLTVPPFWITSALQSANVMIVPVSNTFASNGHYTINATPSSSTFTIKKAYEHNLLSNGHFYYTSSHQGGI